jgi:hypothetical protein
VNSWSTVGCPHSIDPAKVPTDHRPGETFAWSDTIITVIETALSCVIPPAALRWAGFARTPLATISVIQAEVVCARALGSRMDVMMNRMMTLRSDLDFLTSYSHPGTPGVTNTTLPEKSQVQEYGRILIDHKGHRWKLACVFFRAPSCLSQLFEFRKHRDLTLQRCVSRSEVKSSWV